MEKLYAVLKNLEDQGKIKIINNSNFKIIKTGNHINLMVWDDKCEHCNEKSDFQILEIFPDNHSMTNSITCIDCLIYSLEHFDECGWED